MAAIFTLSSKLFLLCALVTFNCEAQESNIQAEYTMFNYPLLIGVSDIPVMRINLETKTENNQKRDIQIILNSTNANNINSVAVYYTQKDSLFNTENKVFTQLLPKEENEINMMLSLPSGDNYFWVTYELKNDTELLTKFEISAKNLIVDGNSISSDSKSESPVLRAGLALKQMGDNGVNTFRIPGLTTTKSGNLLAIYDVRYDSRRDLQGDIDIGLSRSTDGGKSWEPMQIILDKEKFNNLPEKFNGVSDANILVDTNTGDIYVAGLWMHGVINSDGVWVDGLDENSEEWNHQWRNKGSQPGFELKQTSQFLLTKSTDDGKTWSEPRNLTTMLKKEEWWLSAPAPGHGITLKDGTLVFPTQGRDKNGDSFSNITYSKDNGETWESSNIAGNNTTESMVVELPDGSLMLNMRDNLNRQRKGEDNGRYVAVSKDLGKTWTEHPSSNSALIEPVCMASLHKHTYRGLNQENKEILFFSNPNSKDERIKHTIKVSFDNGLSWPEEYWMELDEGKGSGYSCITSLDASTLAILYEGSQAQMTFQLIDISHLVDKK
ncbi:sialidase-1 [Flavobacteriaceae bacterium MAR_2010_188]|nr:sialidase-1 [Flavobacteriaceae bacterium MAR_2010_188]